MQNIKSTSSTTQNYTFSQIPNWFMESLTLFAFNESHVDLLLVIARMSWGYHRDHVDIARSQLSKRAAMAESQVTRNISELISYNVISREAGHYGHVFKINLPDQWRISLKARAKVVPVPVLYTINNERTAPSTDKGYSQSPGGGHSQSPGGGHSQSPGGGHSQSPGGGHSQSPMKEKLLKEKTTTKKDVVVSLPAAEKPPLSITPQSAVSAATNSNTISMPHISTMAITLHNTTISTLTQIKSKVETSLQVIDIKENDTAVVMPIINETTPSPVLTPTATAVSAPSSLSVAALVSAVATSLSADNTHLEGILPQSVNDRDQRDCIKMVAHLDADLAPKVLRVLAEAVENGKIRSTPQGYLFGILQNQKKDSFTESERDRGAVTRAKDQEKRKAEEQAVKKQRLASAAVEEKRNSTVDQIMRAMGPEKAANLRKEFIAHLKKNSKLQYNLYAAQGFESIGFEIMFKLWVEAGGES